MKQASDFTHDVLLSHSSKDKPRVRKLARRLKKAGIRVWLDEWEIKPGDDILLAIEAGLENSRTLVLCMTANAFGSDWVGLERSTVLFRDPSNRGRRFIPVLFQDCEVPEMLRRYQYIDYRTEMRSSLRRLIEACAEQVVADSEPEESEQGTAQKDLHRIIRAHNAEWKRMRKDFEKQARRYTGLKFSIFFVDGNGPSRSDKFERPNHAISLWQYFGSGKDALERMKVMAETKWGVTGAELSAFGLITGEDTELFCRMASQAGGLLATTIDIPIHRNVAKGIVGDGKWITVANRNPLAKWLNLMIMTTMSTHPERLSLSSATIDPFHASLTIFDVYGEELA